MSRPLLIRAGHVLTMDDAGTIAGGEVLIDGDRIAAVGTDLDPTGAEVLDRPDAIVLPGFVDAHRHTWQTSVRHCAVGWDLAAYQANIQGTVGERLTPEDAHIANLLGGLSALDAGITTLRDESHAQNSPAHTDALIAGLREAGIRACFAYGWPSTDAMRWLWDSELALPEDIRRVRAEVLDDDDALVTLQAHLRGPELANLEVTRADVARARELGLRMSMHMGTGVYGELHHGIAALQRAGLLGDDMTFVHCCTSDDEELAMAAAAGASACVTPAVEASMPGLGRPATGRLLARGLRPALGVDIEIATPGDLFSQMRAALAAERLGGGDAPLDAEDLVAFATIDGARALGLDDRIGSLAAGKQADLIVVDLGDAALAPATDPVGSLVAAGHPGAVETVIVAGVVRKRGGRLTHPDVGAVVHRARRSAERLLAPVMAGAGAAASPPIPGGENA